MSRTLFRTLIAFSLFALVGCAWVNTQKDNAKTCINDPTCMAEATSKAKTYGDTAASVASLSGIPAAANVAKPVISYASLIILLCAMGATLKKKQAVE